MWAWLWTWRSLFYLDRAYDPVVGFAAELERLRTSQGGAPLEATLASDLLTLLPAAAAARFAERYLELCTSRFPSLTPAVQRFQEYAHYLTETGFGLEDYSEDLLFSYTPVLLQMERLNVQLTSLRELSAEDRIGIANLVLDLLHTTCLVPAAYQFVPGKHDVHLHFDYQGEVRRNWIHALPSDLLCDALQELRLLAVDVREVKHSFLWSHLEWDAYQRMSVPQRLAQLSLINLMKSPVRSAMMQDPLVQRVTQSAQLIKWMQCCSNMDEQYWLNTCEAAARNNMLCSRMCTVAHCLVLTRLTCEQLRHTGPRLPTDKPWTSTLWGCCCPVRSVAKHFDQLLARVTGHLDEITARAHALLDVQCQDGQLLHQLVLDWNRVVQELASIFYPQEPVVLTRKLFRFVCVCVCVLETRQGWVYVF
jgi:hypothetical protein